MGTEVKALTVTEFVTARLDEDEAVALGATPGPWHVDQVGDFGDKTAVLEVARWRGFVNTVNFGEDQRTPVHIALHDPARVLAQCAAMRQIVERVSDVSWGGYAVRDVILAHLASIWSDHPDWREEWR